VSTRFPIERTTAAVHHGARWGWVCTLVDPLGRKFTGGVLELAGNSPALRALDDHSGAVPTGAFGRPHRQRRVPCSPPWRSPAADARRPPSWLQLAIFGQRMQCFFFLHHRPPPGQPEGDRLPSPPRARPPRCSNLRHTEPPHTPPTGQLSLKVTRAAVDRSRDRSCCATC